MKNIIFIFYSLCAILLYTQCESETEDRYSKETGRMKKLYPAEEYFLSKQYPDGTFSFQAYDRALRELNSFISKAGNRSQGQWIVEGPGNLGARANSIAVSPHDDQRILLGFSAGGLWLTEDGGLQWQPVFDNNAYLSIGDVVFDPIDPNIAYVGTGDPNISGFPFIGNGIHKSTDGGKTWKHLGLTDTRIISQIRISEQNNNIIYVSAMGIPFFKDSNKGVYKSEDGGNTWSQVLFVNDSTGICDMVMHPADHNIIYAAGWNRIRNNKQSIVSGPDAKIYKTVNGGKSWNVLQNGLPQDNSSRIGIDISTSNPNVLYTAYTHQSTFNLKGIFRSDDGGDNWTELPIGQDVGLPENIYAGFGWYFGKIRINPADPNDIFILGVDMHRSINGGQTWELAVPRWFTYEVHADKHDLMFEGDHMYLTTDGGAYKSKINNGQWEDIENIPTTQFYRVAYNPHEPTWYYGGAQDNGSSGGNHDIINNWPRIFGGDGFQMLFHPTDPNIFYAETQNGGLVVTDVGGNFFSSATNGIESSEPRNWDMPVIMSHHNPDILYTGTHRIYKNSKGTLVEWMPISDVMTDNTSSFFQKNISAIAESKTDSLQLVAGTSDGNIWLTKDGGTVWKNITSGLPSKYISGVAIWKDYVLVTMTGYKDADNTPYIYASNDEGQNWIPFQYDLPHIAINSLVILPDLMNTLHPRLVIGTDGGVFYYDGTQKWRRLGENMPVIPVYGLGYNPSLNTVIAGTFGRSIMTFDLSQIESGPVNTDDIEDISSILSLQKNLINKGESIQLNNDSQEKVIVQIFSSNGLVIKNNIFSNGIQTEIPLSNLPSGIYYLKAMNKRYRGALKFVVM